MSYQTRFGFALFRTTSPRRFSSHSPRTAAPTDVRLTTVLLSSTLGLVAVKSSISLTDEQHAFARALVEAGRYTSVSAVLQQGVELLRRRMDAEELETAALRELLSRRRDGEVVSAERMDTLLGSMIAGKRRAHGLPT